MSVFKMTVELMCIAQPEFRYKMNVVRGGEGSQMTGKIFQRDALVANFKNGPKGVITHEYVSTGVTPSMVGCLRELQAFFNSMPMPRLQ